MTVREHCGVVVVVVVFVVVVVVVVVIVVVVVVVVVTLSSPSTSFAAYIGPTLANARGLATNAACCPPRVTLTS